MQTYGISHLRQLESESISILREVAAEYRNPVMLYSVGKDSSVMVRLAQKAFYPAPFPFPLMHIDTGFKFPEMYAFRDRFCHDIGARLIVERNETWIARGCHPLAIGVDKCCSYLKTGALLEAIAKHGFDAAFGGARRDEEKSRAKERIFSIRDTHGQWNPKKQRPEVWDLFNTRLNEGETVRVWQYIRLESIPIEPIYFAMERPVIRRGGILIPVASCSIMGDGSAADEGGGSGALEREETVETVLCRFRSLGCIPCTGAIASAATSVADIVAEVRKARKSERENRVIDLTSDSSMEQKKKEGYF
jgi:sulfate adenylyltransferase subunit 2